MTPPHPHLNQAAAALLADNQTALFELCKQIKGEKLALLARELNQDSTVLYAATTSLKTFEQVWPPFATFILTKFSLPNARTAKQRKAIADVIALYADGTMPDPRAARVAAAAYAAYAADASAASVVYAVSAAVYAASAAAYAAYAAYAAAAAYAASAAAYAAAANYIARDQMRAYLLTILHDPTVSS